MSKLLNEKELAKVAGGVGLASVQDGKSCTNFKCKQCGGTFTVHADDCPKAYRPFDCENCSYYGSNDTCSYPGSTGPSVNVANFGTSIR